MGIVIRQSAQALFITYTGVALGYISTLLLSPLVLSVDEIGFYRILINLSTLFAAFAAFGTYNVSGKFLPHFFNREKKHSGFLTFLLQIGLTGFLITAVLFLSLKSVFIASYSEKSKLIIDYFYLFIPIASFILFARIVETYLAMHQKPVMPAFLREVFLRLAAIAGLLAIAAGAISFSGFVVVTVISYAAALFIIVFYTFRSGLLYLPSAKPMWQSGKVKEIFGYCGFIFLANVSGNIILSIDSMMLGAYQGLASAGIYTIAFFIAQIIEMPRRVLSTVLIRFIGEANKDEDTERLDELYKKSALNQTLIGLLLFIGIWTNIDSVFRLIPNGEVYAAGKWVVFYVGLGRLFDLATGSNAEILLTSRFYRYDLGFYTFLAVIGIVTNVILIPPYGIEGAAIASMITLFLFNFSRSLFLFIVLKIQPLSIGTLKALAAGCAAYGAHLLLPILPSVFLDLAVRSFVILFVFGFISLASKASPDVNHVALSLLRRAKIKSGK